MGNIQLHKESIEHSEQKQFNHSNTYVQDFFDLNTKPKKQSWWKKIIHSKINISGVEHNPIAMKYTLLLPFMIEAFKHIPYANNVGYILALFFSIKAGSALHTYINEEDHANPIKVKQNSLKIIDWILLGTITLGISLISR